MGTKSKKVKILFTISNFNTAGSGKHMVDLIRKLNLDEFEPSICCNDDKGDYFKVVKELGFPIYLRHLSPDRPNYIKGLLGAVKSAWFFKKEGFDLIHSFHWKSDWFEPLAAKLAGVKWMYTKKSMVWHRHWTIRTKLARFIFTLNPEMAEMYPIPKAKSACVGLGPDVDEIIARTRSYDKSELRKEMGMEGKFVLLTVSNIVPEKNVEIILKAMNLLPEANFHLLVVGDNRSEYAQSVMALSQSLALDQKVTFTGKVLDVEKYIAVSDLYLQPTSQYGRSEASGVACMEACSAGLPAIGSDVPGLRFVIGNRELLFKPDDVEALKDMLLKMNNLSEDELKNYSQELQQRMYQLFHMPSVVKDHEKEYFKLMGR